MIKSKRRRQLVYDCASEAVMEARIELSKILDKDNFDKVDGVLSRTQQKCGNYALQALDADIRKPTNFIKVLKG